MFESLEVKDPREASKRFKEALEKERIKHAEKLTKLEKEYARREEEHEMAVNRRDIRIDELKSKLEQAQGSLEVGVTRAQYEKERKAQKANIAQWEKVFQQNEEKWKTTQAKLVRHLGRYCNAAETNTPSSKKVNITGKSTSRNTRTTRKGAWN